MTTLSPRFLQELRDRLTLSEIIGSKVKLIRAGREYKACCPFHKEKTPSFYVNNDKGFYHCFGCGAHGDAVSFKMQYENLSFIEAVEDLAGQAGLSVPKPSQQERQQYDRQKVLYDILEHACRWFQAQCDTDEGVVARRYMAQRGISDDAIERFRLGFAPNSWDAFREAMTARGYKVQDMVELGLLKASPKNDKPPYAFFRGRLIFPVMDRRGRVIAFGGRHMEEAFDPIAMRDKTPPKYLNSPDHLLFHKGQNLYGLARARRAGVDGQPIILAEGYTDVIALVMAGFDGAVAPLGTAVTEDQIMALWKLCMHEGQQPYLCFDGDNAGRGAAYRLMDRALPFIKPGKGLSFMFMPAGEDPDSLIKSGGRMAFDRYLNAAQPLIDVLWLRETEGRDFKAPEARAALEKRLYEAIAGISDRTVQNHYRQEIRDRLYKFFRSKPASGTGYKQQAGPSSVINRSAPLQLPRKSTVNEMRCKILLATIINHPTLLHDFSEMLGMLALPYETLDSLRQWLLVEQDQITPLTAQNVKQHLSEAGFDSTLHSLLGDSVLKHAGFAREDSDEELVRTGFEDTYNLILRDRKAI